MGVFKVESFKKGIVLSTLFNILNKGLVFINGILVAYFFGVSQSTDIFFYVYNSVLILGVYITSLNNSVVIPESMRIRSEGNNRGAMQFLNFFIFLYVGVILALLLIVLGNPVSFFSAISSFKEADLQKHVQLLLLALPLFGMIALISLLVDILASLKFFTISMFVGIINSVFSILFMATLRHSLGIQSVFYGLIISYACNIIMLLYLMRHYLRWKFWLLKPNISKRIWVNLGYAQMGNITSTLSSYMPIYILSGFSTGIITALTFAQQIASLPNALIINQFSSVAGIKFNELYSRKQFEAIDKVFREAADFLLFLMFPISFFMFFFVDEIVHVLLGFTEMKKYSIDYVSLFLRFLVFLLPLYVINNLISRLFMASHKIRESFWYQIIFNVVLIILMYFSVKHFGIIGYPLTLLIVYFLNVWICYFLEKQYFNFIFYKQTLKTFAVLGITNFLLCIALYFVVRSMNIEEDIALLIIAAAIYAISLIFINKVFKFNGTINLYLEGFLKNEL
jgi:putative peptidoglycan lipid II flippase